MNMLDGARGRGMSGTSLSDKVGLKKVQWEGVTQGFRGGIVFCNIRGWGAPRTEETTKRTAQAGGNEKKNEQTPIHEGKLIVEEARMREPGSCRRAMYRLSCEGVRKTYT